MGVRFPSVWSSTILNSTLTLNNTTIICTTPPLNPGIDSATVFVGFLISGTLGASATGIIFKVVAGTLVTSPLVTSLGASNPQTGFPTAGPFAEGGLVFDLPGIVAGQQYSLVMQQVAATGNGAVNNAVLMAFVL